MMNRSLFILFFLILFTFSCKKEEIQHIIFNDDIRLSFNKVNNNSIVRDINYSPNWEQKIEFEGNFYIPLNTDKQIYSYTPDSIKYSLVGKIWLKANKQGEIWNFTKLTVLPNDIKESKKSGLLIYEDWKTGESSYEGYIENTLLSPITYNLNPKMKAYNKKAKAAPGNPCLTIAYTVCAGDDSYTSCTTRYQNVGNCNDGGGGGDTGHYGGEGNTPPITGGGTRSASTFRITFSGQKIDPIKETNCFNTSNSAKLTIYIQQPTENTRKKLGDNSVGHAFIGLEQGELKRYLGFYPDSPNASLISNQNSEIHDNSNEMYHVSISINVSPDKMSSVINYINNYNKKYDLNNYNCADFAIGVAEKAGLNLPRTTGEHSELIFKFKGRNPGDLGQDVRTMNLPNGVTRTTTKSTSGSKQGGC